MQQKDLDQAAVLAASRLVQQGTAGLDCDGLRGKLGAVDVQDGLKARLLQDLLQDLEISVKDEVLDLPNLVLGKQ